MPLETINIDGVEIFAVGTWNGDQYEDKDIEEIAKAYEQTKDAYKPFLKISHDHAQQLAKQSGLSVDEMPALGWMENVRKVGNKLLADFKNVPKKLAELMKVGAFRTRSAEIWSNIEFNGLQLPYMLKAVGLLGADAPAVSGLNTLDDIIALYGAEKAKAYDTKAEAKVYDLTLSASQEEKEMPEIKELQEKLDASAKTIAEYEEKIKTFEKMKCSECGKMVEMQKAMNEKIVALEGSLKDSQERASLAEKKIEEFSKEKRKLEINAKVEGLINSKKLAPAQKEFAIQLLETGLISGEKQYKLGDKEFKSAEEVLFALIEAGSGVTLPTEPGTDAGRATRDDDGGEAQHQLTLKYMEEHKGVGYKQAFLAVTSKEPK